MGAAAARGRGGADLQDVDFELVLQVEFVCEQHGGPVAVRSRAADALLAAPALPGVGREPRGPLLVGTLEGSDHIYSYIL